jgi:colanic acid/amylovoran biosynthesis glycosyltransferase
MPNTLIFLTERYPNEYIGSLYEQKEIENLEGIFKNIFIFSQSSNKNIDERFYFPKNSKFFNINNKLGFVDKIKSLRFLFSIIFFNEIKFVRKKYRIRLSLFLLKIIFIELQKADNLKKEIINQIERNNVSYDQILIYSFWFDYRSLAAAMIKQKYPKIKTITRSHGGDVYFERHPLNYLPLKKYIIDNLDGIYPISLKSEIYIKDKILNSEKVKHFHLGVTNEQNQVEFSLNPSIKIVSCSHIVPIKRVELIIDILSEVTDINFQWFHIGANYIDKNIEEICENKFTKKNQSYSLLGGLSNDQIMKFYQENNIDLFINLSKSEGVPVSIMEAMSFGIPSIATDVGSTSEIVIDEVTGYLLNESPTKNDVTSLLHKYDKLTINEKIKLRTNTFELWNNSFNAFKNYKRYKDEVLEIFKS